MGFSFSLVAVRGIVRESVLGLLGLRGTGAFEEVPESDITGVALPSGWYLIIANGEYPVLTENKTLARFWPPLRSLLSLSKST